MRLDRALVQRGLARSRGEAHSLIEAGQVLLSGLPVRKPRVLVRATDTLEVRGERCPFVSRGGLKLAAALAAFDVPTLGRIALDVGASTGGFSDCLLQAGASEVFAIDVGHGQLAPSLAQEPRLHYREGVNVRGLTPELFTRLFDIITVDLSFISLALVLPVLPPLLNESGDMICLVKPQFEVGQAGLGKGGIVRDDTLRRNALARVIRAAEACGLCEQGSMESPVVGGSGNHEFLVWLKASAGLQSALRE